MIKKAAMTIIFALLWSFFIGESSNVLANYDSDSMWSLLPVNCEQEFECQTRLSLEGDLFTFVNSTSTLYVSKKGVETYQEYSLIPYKLWTCCNMDFVPYSTENIVIFYADSGKPTLTKLDLSTGLMTLMPQTEIFRRLVPCTPYITSLLINPKGYITRIGLGNQLLICSSSANQTTPIHIVNVTTEETIQTIDFGSPERDFGPDWTYLIAGQDGNIYFIYQGLNQIPNSEIFQNLIHPLPISPVDEFGYWVVQLDVSSIIWNANFILSREINDGSINRSFVTRVINVNIEGEFLFWSLWEQLDASSSNIKWSLSRYTQELQLIDRLTNDDVGEISLFYGITSDGLALFIGNGGLSESIIVETNPNPAIAIFLEYIADVESNAAIFPYVVVEVRDTYNRLMADVPVTITLGSNGSNGILSGGEETLTDENGQAIFDMISVNSAGIYTLIANGETETNPNDYLGVFYAKTSIKDRLDFKSSLHNVGDMTVESNSFTITPPPSINLAQSDTSITITESGATDTYTLALGTQPTADVVVSVMGTDQIAVSPSTLTFTPQNWDVPQTVTVSAVDDSMVEGDHTAVITHSAVSTDAGYNGISVTDVMVSITDNDGHP